VSQRLLPAVEMRVISQRTTVTTLTGEHDLLTKQRLLETIACARQWPNVIVDLTPCEFIDSTICEVLITADRVRQPGERLELAMPLDDGFVNRTLTLLGLREIIPTHESLADALLTVGEPHPFAVSPSDSSGRSV
jgi:anti-anti-sigma factor